MSIVRPDPHVSYFPKIKTFQEIPLNMEFSEEINLNDNIECIHLRAKVFL